MPTGAKDMAPLSSDESDSQELIDVHMYNHFYTFQVDRKVAEANEGIEMLIPAEKFKTSSDGFAFRLHAEFNSAEGSRTEMGFRASLLRQDPETKQRTLVKDASTLDLIDGEGQVHIDIPQLESGVDYVLRYEFYLKEVIRRESLAIEEDTIASRDALIWCNLPFFT